MNTANKIEIYTTKNCSFCKKAKLILEKYEVFSEIDVEDKEKRKLMTKRSNGLRTVPQIFINNKHIGGYDQLKLLEQNKSLVKLLKMNKKDLNIRYYFRKILGVFYFLLSITWVLYKGIGNLSIGDIFIAISLVLFGTYVIKYKKSVK